jgi:hypothetical protein
MLETLITCSACPLSHCWSAWNELIDLFLEDHHLNGGYFAHGGDFLGGAVGEQLINYGHDLQLLNLLIDGARVAQVAVTQATGSCAETGNDNLRDGY